MNKNILIGSIFVLTLLLVMPSIPAVQMNYINNRIIEEYKEINFIDLIRTDLPSKYPILFLIVLSLFYFRVLRGMVLWEVATEWRGYYFDVVNSWIFFRCIILLGTASIRYNSWRLISKIFGWDWDV